MSNVKRSDWARVDGFSIVGTVTSVSRDGETAMVDWGTHKKRMPVSKLLVQTTIPFGANGTVTDLTREQELAQQNSPAC